MPLPFIDMDPLPAIPQGVPCCIWQVFRAASGDRTVSLDPGSYTCGQHQTQFGYASIDFGLTIIRPPDGGQGCNETEDVPDNLKLVTSGPLIQRDDRLAIYSAAVQLNDAAGNTQYSGWIELYERIGTHPSEHCAPENHIEGWLVAQGTNKPNQALHLEIVGSVRVPGGSGYVSLRLNGILVVHP
jgi:hypothetical protein